MLDRAERGLRAAILAVGEPRPPSGEATAEIRELVRAAGAEPIRVVTAAIVDKPVPATLVGKGKVAELVDAVCADDCDLVIVDRALSPVQERNLERELCCRVLDRTSVILDIFAQRARSHEGKLQVELAQLRHLATRLVRGWSHLERQKGGIGLRGPGETQLETDRRLVNDRIRLLQRRLDKVDRRRHQGRRGRQRSGVPSVALVGYTNAGKSTLFNRLTTAEVEVRDQLFATLDPTVRKLVHPILGRVLLSDTVGFVSDLPHELVAAFRSTLQETRDADLLLHVIDAIEPDRDRRVADVKAVLEVIGAGDRPTLLVYNKIDRGVGAAGIRRDAAGRVRSVHVSARTGAGLDALLHAITEKLDIERVRGWFSVPFAAAELRARLFDLGAVAGEKDADESGFRLRLDLASSDAERLARLPGVCGEVAERVLLQ